MARRSSRAIEQKTERCFVKALVLAVGLLAVNGVAAVAASPGANPFDGTWAEVIVGENKVCDVVVNTSFTVSNGHFSQNYSSGEVSPNGSAKGTANANGVTGTWTGHFSGNKASGRFTRTDGCIGRWSAVRQ
jgi:hypothetical protein